MESDNRNWILQYAFEKILLPFKRERKVRGIGHYHRLYISSVIASVIAVYEEHEYL